MAELFATARVTLTVEVDAASWDTKASAQEIMQCAGREAKNKLEILFQRERGVRVIGEPKVTFVTGIVKER